MEHTLVNYSLEKKSQFLLTADGHLISSFCYLCSVYTHFDRFNLNLSAANKREGTDDLRNLFTAVPLKFS